MNHITKLALVALLVAFALCAFAPRARTPLPVPEGAVGSASADRAVADAALAAEDARISSLLERR